MDYQKFQTFLLTFYPLLIIIFLYIFHYISLQFIISSYLIFCLFKYFYQKCELSFIPTNFNKKLINSCPNLKYANFKQYFPLPFVLIQFIGTKLSKFQSQKKIILTEEKINEFGSTLIWVNYEGRKNPHNKPILFIMPGITGKFSDAYVFNLSYQGLENDYDVVIYQMRTLSSEMKMPKKRYVNFCEDITCLCPGLTIVFNGHEIIHENGISDLLKKHLGKDIEIINNPLIIQEKKDKQAISLAMSYTTRGSSNIVPYVNCGITSAGPHITSIKSTITRILNKWAKEQGILKATDKNLDGASLQEGMVLVANITAEGVSYDAQVKSTITKIDTGFISSTLGEQLEIWLDNNIEDGKNIIEKALVARKAAEAAKKARERVKAKATTPVKAKAIQLPTTLTDCWSKDRSKCELFVCEGKSAAAGLVAGRDSETQAIYGVRGKMLSVLKTAPANIYKNQEINNLVQALGLEVDEATCTLTYDEKKLRYGKIIAAADADFDGFAIENLLFNILWYMCPDLIVNGHVYSAVPPLFRVTTKKNEYIYLRDAEALAAYQKEHGAEVQSIGRLKGLGEQDSDELSYCLLDPETRNVLQLRVEDYGKTDKMFQDLYGKRVEPRVQFLAQHLEEARVD